MSARAVYVVATAAVSPFGLDAAALVAGLRGEGSAAASGMLAASHPAVAALGVEAVPPARDPVPAKARKTMSRGAYLGAVALRAAVEGAGWNDRDGVGVFLGVGASGGAMTELETILAAALRRGGPEMPSEDGMLPPRILSPRFVAACHPLLAFQLMNNFTMCHGAILAGTTGPSGAFFSRGAGTVTALVEAVESVRAGECERALAGGADSALHPVTWLEHQRLADTPVRLPASEGAGLVALAAVAPASGLAIVVEAAAQVTRADDPAARAAALVRAAGPCELVIVGADDAGQQALLARGGGERLALDGLGTCLAATPALGWVAAVERVREGARRVAVVTLDGAGDLAVAVFARAAGGAA